MKYDWKFRLTGTWTDICFVMGYLIDIPCLWLTSKKDYAKLSGKANKWVDILWNKLKD